jgi:hypothetical protein
VTKAVEATWALVKMPNELLFYFKGRAFSFTPAPLGDKHASITRET